MNTRVEQIEASAPAWPQLDTADVLDLIDRLLQAADGLSSHSKARHEGWAYPPETLWPAQVRDDGSSRFGDIKSVLGFRQFLLRGLDCVRGEWNLVTLAWNMKRMFALCSTA
jgi:hypothetical protein